MGTPNADQTKPPDVCLVNSGRNNGNNKDGVVFCVIVVLDRSDQAKQLKINLKPENYSDKRIL